MTSNISIIDEINDMHSDLARWIGSPDEFEARNRFVTQLHSEFSQISIDGSTLSHQQLHYLLDEIGYSAPGMTIDIRDVSVLHQSTYCVLVRFREIHHTPDLSSSRLVTALLLTDPLGRNGLKWRFVHEMAEGAWAP
ncbi:hypothetical protein [Nocardia sp. CA-119907]|uniref:hypothetical protein n=1 Tax=Nocardia sp. CA-119907 TaxID=3239973 RepID=UPI003D9606B0